MTPDTMRFLDRTFGQPVCLGLSALRACGLGRARPGRLQNVRRILFIKLAEMGATVILDPTLRRARELWPNCEFHFLVFEENKGAVALLQGIGPEHVSTIRAKSLGEFATDLPKRIRELRRMRFDAVIDLEFFSRASAIIAGMVGARARVGFSRYTMEGLYKGTLMTHPVQYNPHLHTAVSYLTLVEALDQEASQVPLAKVVPTALDDLNIPRFVPSDDERLVIETRLHAANPAWNPARHRLVILNVNSSELVPLRRWPLERFIELGRRLLSEPDVYLVLTGTRSETAESEQVARSIGEGRILNMVGKTNLRELLTLYSRCQLMVTNDSGPGHFAGLTPMPTIVLFGPETPTVFGPLGPGKVAITAGLACSPCVSVYNHRKTACTHNACMFAINVDRVYAAARKLLESTAATPTTASVSAIASAPATAPAD